ncbi:MAG TPA: hypothetical protein VF037_00550 [Gemmatimonadales bacterium]
MSITVFVNERPVAVPGGSTVAAAVTAFDAGLGRKLADGTARVTDARGIELEPAASLRAGSIIRVLPGARHPDADA